MNVAWNATYRVNKLDRNQWERTVFAQVKSFQRRTMWSIKRGYDGKEYGIQAQWTFTGAFLYRYMCFVVYDFIDKTLISA